METACARLAIRAATPATSWRCCSVAAPAVAARRRASSASTGTSKVPTDAFRIYDQIKQKFGYMGTVNKKEIDSRVLFKILAAGKKPSDFSWALHAMNLFYNFGVKLRDREIASRYLSAAMVCKAESEAVEIIKLYGTWLQHPPDIALVYGVMGHYLDAGENLIVREIAQAVREDWRLPVHAPLYHLAVEAMLRLPKNAVAEAASLHMDARQMGVGLPAPVHQRLLNASLSAYCAAKGEEGAGAPPSPEGIALLKAALQAAEGLARDGHLLGGASAASGCSVAWLCLHLGRLTDAARREVFDGAECAAVMPELDAGWQHSLRMASEDFGCHWGFSANLPAGFFQDLEELAQAASAGGDCAAASGEEEERAAVPVAATPDAAAAAELLRLSRERFGRFYPASATA